MIIRSLRLKNIKSYGEGPNGNGVTIHFEPGINRIAGKNGHGKSTLIESLGFALFLTKPVYEEGFDVATYLLRSGTKSGEIDVVFECAGRTYRLERGLGSQNKRRAKIVLASDASTEAEGDEEVSNYLSRLFGFADEARFSELFSKLIGVRQGRLTWPFDSKPTEARKYFEPLLDVEIFRQCFDRLKPVADRFEELRSQRQIALAGVAERIRERADSPERVNLKQHETAELEKKVEVARDAKDAADLQRQIHERKEQAHREAKTQFDSAANNLRLAAQKKQEDELRLRESQEAFDTVRVTQPAYESYLKAEQTLRQLQEKQNEKSWLENQRAKAGNSWTEWASKAKAARDQAKNYADQKDARAKRAEELRNQIDAGQKALAEAKPEFDRLFAATEAARRSWNALNQWAERLGTEAEENADLLTGILEDWKKIEAWDSESLADARAEEEKKSKAEKDLANKLAAAQKFEETLSEQLKEISGGVCPFLKEKCRQFDPKKIEADISTQKKEIKRLIKEHAEAAQAQKLAKAVADKLTREAAGLDQLAKSIGKNVESFVSAHNKLSSAAVQKHFTALQDYLPRNAAVLRIPPPAQVEAKDCYEGSGTNLATKALQELIKSERTFQRQAVTALEKIAEDLDSRFKAFESQSHDRLRTERDLKNKQEQLAETESEINEFSAKIERLGQAAAEADKETATAISRIAELEKKLEPHASLEKDIAEQQRIKDQNADAYQRHLGAKPAADLLVARRAALKNSAVAEAQANEAMRRQREVCELAQREFDPAALADARAKAEEAGNKLAAESVRRETARKELEREQKRFEEWQAACRDKDDLLTALGRLDACIELTEKARYTLRNAAPKVAQHVCRHIAARAQQIFNQINDDPVELDWGAERYSLRIDPGERRFAMLSGGEQTKLALAMTLAMIQEFSGLKFCVFDEPTYGVDADSRQKLADAILRLQDVNESKLDQLLLVSHDDAFEGKIEHVVVIRKTASDGSLPLMQT